jgi:Helix-turn-helix domain
MPRRQTPLSPDGGPAARFSLALRGLRDSSGPSAPNMAHLIERTGLSSAAVYAAFSGSRVSSWPTVEIIVTALHGDTREWFARWREADAAVELDRRRRRHGKGGKTIAAPALRFGVADVPSYMIDPDNPANLFVDPPPSVAAWGEARRQLAQELAQLQVRAGMSFRRLSEVSQIPKSNLSRLVRGIGGLPSWETVEKIAEGLNADPDQLRPLWEQAYLARRN